MRKTRNSKISKRGRHSVLMGTFLVSLSSITLISSGFSAWTLSTPSFLGGFEFEAGDILSSSDYITCDAIVISEYCDEGFIVDEEIKNIATITFSFRVNAAPSGKKTLSLNGASFLFEVFPSGVGLWNIIHGSQSANLSFRGGFTEKSAIAFNESRQSFTFSSNVAAAVLGSTLFQAWVDLTLDFSNIYSYDTFISDSIASTVFDVAAFQVNSLVVGDFS